MPGSSGLAGLSAREIGLHAQRAPPGSVENGQSRLSHPTARSYWHAWTPDGHTIAYTASRPESGSDDYDIYTKRADGVGREHNFTHSMGLDDGPEYTPDGQYLYFNSTRSGAMQIWRARARDGANPERITRTAGLVGSISFSGKLSSANWSRMPRAPR